MQITFQTDVGRCRSVNQDTVNCFYNASHQPLMVLGDGMGGHRAGDVASRMAVSLCGDEWTAAPEFQSAAELSRWMVEIVQKINEKIYRASREGEHLEGMGTTLVLAAVAEDRLVLVHVGDSRAYCINGRIIRQLTEDHSLVNEFVKSGEITAVEARQHPGKNILTRSVGVLPKVEADMAIHPLHPEETLLLCSDGLTNMLSDETIRSLILEQETLEEAVATLIREANTAGGKDNISVLLAQFSFDEGGER